jgi:hypothetical protein
MGAQPLMDHCLIKLHLAEKGVLSMNDYFKEFKSSEPLYPEFKQCPEGEHEFKIKMSRGIDSFTNANGKQKDNLPEWVNPTPQILLLLEATDGSGQHYHRLNGCGWKKMEDLTKAELESENFSESHGYAIKLDEKGENWIRIEKPENTEACGNILNQFFYALGLPYGTTLDKGLERAKADGYVFMATITKEAYQDPESGKESDQFRMKNFRRVPESADVQDSDWEAEEPAK